MAARENQGYLIAIIVLVLLSLVLAVTAFLGVQKAYEKADSAESLDAKLQVSRKIAEAGDLKGEALKSIIGLGVAPAELPAIRSDLINLSTQLSDPADRKIVEDIVEEVKTAEEIYKVEIGGTVADGGDGAVSATLRHRIDELTSLVDDTRKRFKLQVDLTEQAESDAAAKIKSAEESLASALKEKDEINEKLNKAKQDALINEQTLRKEVEASIAALDEVKRKSSEMTGQLQQSIDAAENQVALLEIEKANLKIRLNKLDGKVYDHADGQVVRVAGELNMVFIDIGRADGLQNNSTFAVYDQSVTNFETATAKASIEVVRVDTFRAEARIISENPVNPILKYDHILTPTWDPGFKLKIALAGRFDLDGDRYDDTEKLVRLIERNGGTVVARHDEKGNVTGEISPEVRYLVKGNEALIGSEDDPDAGKILETLKSMEGEADRNTVQVIDLQKLLNRLGVGAQPKTQQLDFPPGGFKQRQPGAIRNTGSSTRDSAGSSTR